MRIIKHILSILGLIFVYITIIKPSQFIYQGLYGTAKYMDYPKKIGEFWQRNYYYDTINNIMSNYLDRFIIEAIIFALVIYGLVILVYKYALKKPTRTGAIDDVIKPKKKIKHKIVIISLIVLDVLVIQPSQFIKLGYYGDLKYIEYPKKIVEIFRNMYEKNDVLDAYIFGHLIESVIKVLVLYGVLRLIIFILRTTVKRIIHELKQWIRNVSNEK